MATKAIQVDFAEAAAPANPDAGEVRLYAKADGLLYSKDDAGAETLVSGGSGGSGAIVDSHVATCSAAITLTTTPADVTGATLDITPAVPEIWIVDVIFDFRLTVATDDVAVGVVDLDGVDQTGSAILQINDAITGRGTVAQEYRIAASAAAHTIKLQASKTGAGGTWEAQTNSRIRVLRYVA